MSESASLKEHTADARDIDGSRLVADAMFSDGEPLRLESRTCGSSSAELTVFEISDFQCSACAAFSRSIYPQLEQKYIKTGLVRWTFLHWPKMNKHANAFRAAEFAQAAALQRRFWPMQSALFESQSLWANETNPEPVFEDIARTVGLNLDEMAKAIADGRVASEVASDMTYVSRWRLSFVPSFVGLDEVVFAGCPDEERQLGEWIDRALSQRSR